MAFPTMVNDQITDAVTQSNVKVLGEAPAMALASLFQANALALSLAAQNAVTTQQNLTILSQAATAAAVASLIAEPVKGL